jgi:hemolysin III
VHTCDLFTCGPRDPLSAATHLLAAAWALLLTPTLVIPARGWLRRGCALCFGLSLILLYSASATYHAARLPQAGLDVLRRLDHSAIYVLIAASFTPPLAVLTRGPLRAGMLAVIWSIAAAGVAAKWLLPLGPQSLVVGLYVAMGWLAVVPARAIARAVGWRGLAWIVAGGAFYTLGGLCEAVCWPNPLPGVLGPHEMLHIFTVAGSAAHVRFMQRYVLPFQGPAAGAPAAELAAAGA